MEDLSIGRQLFAKQQKGELTDCSFRFKIKTEDGKVEEKIIHAHKLILSVASKYFEINFKVEWSNNEPIFIETVEFDVFEKLIRAIYLTKIDFKNLEEAANLYEAAHFYQMEDVLEMLRREIEKFCKEKKEFRISAIGKIALEFQDYMLMHLATKIFCANASRIIKDTDFMNFTPDVINWLYQYDELSADEKDLFTALEKIVENGKICVDKIKPAISSLRLIPAFLKHELENTKLLTEMEKDILLEGEKHCLMVGNESNMKYVTRNKPQRTQKSFLSHLPEFIQDELLQKLNNRYCQVCEQSHNVFNCGDAEACYPVYKDLRAFMTNEHITKLKSNCIIKALKILEKAGETCEYFENFNNIDDILKDVKKRNEYYFPEESDEL